MASEKARCSLDWTMRPTGGGRARRAQTEAARRSVTESEVRLNEARINFERVSKLVKVGYSTAAEVDAARAAVESLEARIRAAREQVRVAERQVALELTNLDSTIIRAPFDGVAISKDAQPGEMVSPVCGGASLHRNRHLSHMRSLEARSGALSSSYVKTDKRSRP